MLKVGRLTGGRMIPQQSAVGINAIIALSSVTALYQPTEGYVMSGRSGVDAAVVDGPVGQMLAAKGTNHLTAGSDAGRPTLRAGDGKRWLEFDGADDAFAFATNLAGVTHAIFAIQTTDADGVLIHHNGIGGIIAPHIPVFQSASPAASTTGLTSPQVVVNRGSHISTRASLHAAVASASPVVISVSFAALAAVASPAYGGYATASSQFRFAHKLYGMCVLSSPSAGDVSAVEDYIATLPGVTLP